MKKYIGITLLLTVVLLSGCQSQTGANQTKTTPSQSTSVTIPQENNKIDSVSTTNEQQTDEWKINISGHSYTVDVKKNINDLVATLNDGKQTYSLKKQEFVPVHDLDIQNLSGENGERTLLISSFSGDTIGDINYVIIAYDEANKKPVFKNPFDVLNRSNFYAFPDKIKDKTMYKWVFDQKMGYKKGRFQDVSKINKNKAEVGYSVGYHPELLNGDATVQFNFKKSSFELVSINNATFEDPLTSGYCNGMQKINHYSYGEILGYKNEYNADVSIVEEGMKMLYKFSICGESFDKQLKNGSYYLIETVDLYSEKPSLIKDFLNFGVSTDIKDEEGHDVYTIALAKEVKDQDVLNQLSKTLTKEQIEKDKQIIKLTLYGSTLSIDDIKKIKDQGISLNESLAKYSYVYMAEGKKYEGGTILASALLNNDYDKAKWLLENGADPNGSFGTSEHHISNLNYSLSNNLKMADLLLQYGAKVDEIEQQNSAPITLTLLAQYTCNKEITDLLIKYGAKKWYYQEEGKEVTKEDLIKNCK